MTNEKIAELRQAAEYAKTHGGGSIPVLADDVLEMLPEPKADQGDVIAEAVAASIPLPNETAAAVTAEQIAEHPTAPVVEMLRIPGEEPNLERVGETVVDPDKYKV